MCSSDLRAFSSCGERGPLFIAACGPLTVAASLLAEHRLQTRRLSNCGSRAQLLRGMWDLPGPGLEPVSPQPRVPQPLRHQGSPAFLFFRSDFSFSILWTLRVDELASASGTHGLSSRPAGPMHTNQAGGHQLWAAEMPPLGSPRGTHLFVLNAFQLVCRFHTSSPVPSYVRVLVEESRFSLTHRMLPDHCFLNPGFPKQVWNKLCQYFSCKIGKRRGQFLFVPASTALVYTVAYSTSTRLVTRR